MPDKPLSLEAEYRKGLPGKMKPGEPGVTYRGKSPKPVTVKAKGGAPVKDSQPKNVNPDTLDMLLDKAKASREAKVRSLLWTWISESRVLNIPVSDASVDSRAKLCVDAVARKLVPLIDQGIDPRWPLSQAKTMARLIFMKYACRASRPALEAAAITADELAETARELLRTETERLKVLADGARTKEVEENQKLARWDLEHIKLRQLMADHEWLGAFAGDLPDIPQVRAQSFTTTDDGAIKVTHAKPVKATPFTPAPAEPVGSSEPDTSLYEPLAPVGGLDDDE